MKKGVALIEGYNGKGLIEAVDAWTKDAGQTPDIVPIWARMEIERPFPSGELLALRARGIEGCVYMESHGTTYTDILLGAWDDRFKRWAGAAALYGHPIVVRWDHEMNGTFMPWGGTSPELYKEVFRYVSELLKSIAPNIRMWYCPIRRGKSRQEEIEAYYPGSACAVVGFDIYDSKRYSRPIHKKARGTVETLRRIAPGKPLWIGEFGKAPKTGSRRRWLRGLDKLDANAVLYFDMNLGPGHIWALTPRLRRFYMNGS